MLFVHVWWWLQENNLLKAVVAWSVGLALNSVWAVRLWTKKKREDRLHRAELMDKLDTGTPGGLGEIKRLISQEQDPNDDNGSDPGPNDSPRKSAPRSSGSWPDIMHDVKGGGSSAGHH